MKRRFSDEKQDHEILNQGMKHLEYLRNICILLFLTDVYTIKKKNTAFQNQNNFRSNVNYLISTVINKTFLKNMFQYRAAN